jgi:3-dehydroquinate synthase
VRALTQFTELIQLVKSNVNSCFVLCDENTFKHCFPVFSTQIGQTLKSIIIQSGEVQKNMATCEYIWQRLLEVNADKNAILINLGGGVVSDIGGFVAATYKRGIKYVNIPTTLLAMVDASTGGKTGVNFEHYKNIIGVINQPAMVVIHTPFLKTLANGHLKNGFAEMLKHALLNSNDAIDELMQIDINLLQLNDNTILKSLEVKEAIVALDPLEHGPRKVLNFGHTIGHAIEFAAQEKGFEIFHGQAVALGMIVAIKLSTFKMGFDQSKANSIIQYLKLNYPTPNWVKYSYSTILKAILQDKKNHNNEVKMVLLSEIGKPVYNITCSITEIESAFTEL